MARIRVMDDRFFNECIVRDECSKLASVLSAIEKWEDVAAAEWRASEPDTANMSDEQAHWAADHFNDQAYMMHETKKSMLGSFAVASASSVENFFGALCEDRLAADPPRNFGVVRQGLETSLGVVFNTLAGHDDARRLRVLGNCFKHNASRKNDEFVRAFGGNIDDEIDFTAEDWPTLVEATRLFLLELVSHT